MKQSNSENYPSHVLMSDFDGTMTRRDFFKLAIQQLLPPDGPDFWGEYRAGRITHFEALRRYFAEIRASEAEVLAVVDQMDLDPGLPQAVADLQRAGWEVIVTSAGCDWYIRRLLAQAGVELEVHSNPGRFVPGLGLQMEMPVGSPFLSPTLGVDKARIVRQHLEQAARWPLPVTGSPTRRPPSWCPAGCGSPTATWPTFSHRKARSISGSRIARRSRSTF